MISIFLPWLNLLYLRCTPFFKFRQDACFIFLNNTQINKTNTGTYNTQKMKKIYERVQNWKILIKKKKVTIILKRFVYVK